MSEKYMLLYVTACSRDEAVMLARTLVTERLAACANVLGGITSIYWWEGQVNEGGEVALLIKTRAEMVEASTSRIKNYTLTPAPASSPCPLSAGIRLSWNGSELKQRRAFNRMQTSTWHGRNPTIRLFRF